jgi:hypothetical protein
MSFSTKEIREELRACTLKIPCRSAKHNAGACITKVMLRENERSNDDAQLVYSTGGLGRKIYLR